MCGNIKNLRRLTPPATPVDVDAAVLQYVRKISGVRKPSGENTEVFNGALAAIGSSVTALLAGLTSAAPRARTFRAVDGGD